MIRLRRKIAVAIVAILAVATGYLVLESAPAEAADHTDPPSRVDGGDADDIGDIYAWHDSTDDTLTVVLTFAGPIAPAADQTGTYDADKLYGIHIDNSGDNSANFNIWVRFGQNSLGDWGVQVENLPGTTGPVVGPVETTVSGEGGTQVWAGLRDDPFFMDLTGFQDTVASGDLSFDPTRDFFEGLNITAVVLEMSLPAAAGGNTDLQVWSTTGTL